MSGSNPPEEYTADNNGLIRLRLDGQRVIAKLIDLVVVNERCFAILEVIDPPQPDKLVRLYKLDDWLNAHLPPVDDSALEREVLEVYERQTSGSTP